MTKAKSTPYTSIIKIVTNAIQFTARNILAFLKYWALPFLASVAFYALTVGLTSKLPSNILSPFIENIMYLASAAISLAAASYWVPKWIHFYETGKSSPLFEYGSINRIYFRKSFSFTAIAIVALMLITGITQALHHISSAMNLLAAIVLIPAFFYLCYRFCFVIPAAALGETITFRDSWDKTSKGTWQFLGLILLLTLLVNLPFVLIGLFVATLSHLKGGGLLGTLIILGSILLFVANVLFFGAFSIAWTNFYKRIR